MNNNSANIWDLIKFNWKAGLTVSLVSIPLSIALAIASGATPTQGLITAFWAGLIGAMLGGSNFNIIGPTGALSGMLILYTISYGYQGLPFIAIISGLLILLAYFFRFDKYIIFIPSSVIHGFALGVAVIIAGGQIDNALGLEGIPKTENLLHNIVTSIQHLSDVNLAVLAMFVFGVLFIILWNKKFSRIPGSIVFATFAILLSFILSRTSSAINLPTLGQRYPEIKAQLFINIFEGMNLSLFYNKEIWIISLATALIAILETLLSGQIADNMTKTKFNRPKEVFGLGIANIGSGLCGGIPATAALARTALNVKSHATHRISGIINAIGILIITFLVLQYFKWLPMVAIASILVCVAIGMVEKKHFIKLLDNERAAFFVSLIVAIITFAQDPMLGILVGTIIGLLIFVHNVAKGQTEIIIWKKGHFQASFLRRDFVKLKEVDSDMVIYKISGTLTYINMPAHLEAMEKIKGNDNVIVSLRHAFYADTDGIHYLEELLEILKNNNKKVMISGINPEIERLMEKEDFYKKKLVEGKIYKRTSEAIEDLTKAKARRKYRELR